MVGCDGRHSTRARARRPVADDFGAPMDVLWFRLPRIEDDPKEVFGRAAFRRMLVLLNRDDYWQAATSSRRAARTELRERGRRVP